MTSPIGVQRAYLRRATCKPKKKTYSRVDAPKVVDDAGQNGGQVGNGAGTVTGILEVPKYWPPSNTTPIHRFKFRPREASQPGRPAQCPALKRPASAYEPPRNSSMRGYWAASAAFAEGDGDGTVAGDGTGAGEG